MNDTNKTIKADIIKIKINEEQIKYRDGFRAKVKTFRVFQEKVKKRTGAVRTKEKRDQHRNRMK